MIHPLKEISRFIACMNKKDTHHVGYCGDHEQEIYQQLKEDFTKDCIFAYYENKDLIGVLVIDIDEEERSAELWGPFINDTENWNKIAEHLWTNMKRNIVSDVETYYAFYNKRNSRAHSFLKNKKGVHLGEHVILEATIRTMENVCSNNVELLLKGDYNAFVALHNYHFPNTYINGEQIIEKINENNKVFVYKEKGNLLGYVYVECNPLFNESNIEFLAVHKKIRNKGIGRNLLKTAVHFLLNDRKIEKVRLCVDKENKKAITLYMNASFEVKHELSFFRVNSIDR